ncbi:hypothetical protein EVG20_g8490 [Dentipellis fragilis]|uniref:DUF6533 domain-containing protein n=1 Tax=Dentipellis fragilis TaxID=205917 RepID=A0A4Y9Y6Q5_9AGAM|nr:hypothetical protein EVG20_g8490 [Dentipellis fragilis]
MRILSQLRIDVRTCQVFEVMILIFSCISAEPSFEALRVAAPVETIPAINHWSSEMLSSWLGLIHQRDLATVRRKAGRRYFLWAVIGEDIPLLFRDSSVTDSALAYHVFTRISTRPAGLEMLTAPSEKSRASSCFDPRVFPCIKRTQGHAGRPLTSNMDPAQAELLVSAVKDVWIVGCFGLSSLVLLFYDHILTFPDEVELIWRSRWSVSKVIFLMNRYIPYIDTVFDVYQQLGYNVSNGTCHTLYTTGGYEPGVMVFGARLSETIVAARTWAIWGGGREIAFGLGTLFVTDLILVGIFVDDFLRSMEFSQPIGLLPVIRGCFVSKAKKTLYISYIIPLVYETIVTGLFMVKGLEHFKRRTSPLMYQVYRDGRIYHTTHPGSTRYPCNPHHAHRAEYSTQCASSCPRYIPSRRDGAGHDVGGIEVSPARLGSVVSSRWVHDWLRVRRRNYLTPTASLRMHAISAILSFGLVPQVEQLPEAMENPSMRHQRAASNLTSAFEEAEALTSRERGIYMRLCNWGSSSAGVPTFLLSVPQESRNHGDVRVATGMAAGRGRHHSQSEREMASPKAACQHPSPKKYKYRLTSVPAQRIHSSDRRVGAESDLAVHDGSTCVTTPTAVACKRRLSLTSGSSVLRRPSSFLGDDLLTHKLCTLPPYAESRQAGSPVGLGEATMTHISFRRMTRCTACIYANGIVLVAKKPHHGNCGYTGRDWSMQQGYRAHLECTGHGEDARGATRVRRGRGGRGTMSTRSLRDEQGTARRQRGRAGRSREARDTAGGAGHGREARDTTRMRRERGRAGDDEDARGRMRTRGDACEVRRTRVMRGGTTVTRQGAPATTEACREREGRDEGDNTSGRRHRVTTR